MADVTEQVLLQIAENMERAVDDELQRVEEMDDDELLLIRKKRIEQLREVERRKAEWIKKGHGGYNEVPDPATFFENVKSSERVIVHFMRRSTPRCQIIERHLRLLAKEHFETRFCYVDCERLPALPERFNVLMLPTLMLVEKQHTFHSIIGFDEFGGHDDFTTETVASVLSQYGMINPNGMFAADQTMGEVLKEGFAAAATSKYPNYVADRELCKQFFEEFIDSNNSKKYMEMALEVANRSRKVFVVELDDMVRYGQLYLAQRIQMNAIGYIEELQGVIDNLIPSTNIVQNIVDQLVLEARASGEVIPPLLSRYYELDIVPIHRVTNPIPLRALKGELIGTLTVLRGICIAATAIKPKLAMLVSVCELCAATTFQQVIGDRLTPLQICQSTHCRLTNAVGRLLPQYKASKFLKYQELRIQELPQDVPRGAIPRTIRVVCEGEQTRIASPGHVIRITGVYVPDPSTGQGHEAFRASTMVKTIYKAIHIELEKRSYKEAADDLYSQIQEIRKYPDRNTVIEKLTRSIAPEIWGMEDVKKALLCQLVGGSSITNGIRIRSDLNILFMGDPGVAKSQLLKWIASVAPRSVFTTGKGSSGVGLTAAVTRDAHTGEVMLEGGALVLSDHGICCIDEFDKMDEVDRTSLHEVMEQQTVSIAKAGIITSLNARTSILAASNPKYGRWRRNATPTENVNLPPALLSRFDLLWLLLDEFNRERDTELSMHVTHVHLHGVAPGEITEGGLQGTSTEYFKRDFLRAYIGEARKVNPTIDPAAGKAITDIYCEMRAQSARQSNVVTARSLLSLIRLSQACARLRFSSKVMETDVREAGRLLDCSKASLQDRPVSDSRNFVTTSDAGIFTIIKDIARRRTSVSLTEIRPALMLKGIPEVQLQRCLRTYSEVGVWSVSGTNIEFSDD